MAVAAVLDVEPAWVADPDPGAAAILAHHWPTVPNLGDITAVDWMAVPSIDVLAAGYPCQPFSAAGPRKGTADARHLWPNIATALRVLRPALAIFENVPGHIGLGFDAVLADLAALGFDAEWRTLRASDVGAPHKRERLFVLARHPDRMARTAPLAVDRRPRPLDGPEPLQRAVRPDRLPVPDADRRRLSGHPERDSATHGAQTHHADRRVDPRRRVLDWGDYAPAIDRWTRVLGRPAPRPTEPGRTGDRLSPVFVEWLMGLPDGHVTAVPGLTRNQMLKALGNGVVWQQGAAALDDLLDRMEAA